MPTSCRCASLGERHSHLLATPVPLSAHNAVMMEPSQGGSKTSGVTWNEERPVRARLGVGR